MEDSSGSDGCLCCSDVPGHFFCNECFSNVVISQVTGVGKPVFLSNGCHVSCLLCQESGLRTVFDMQLYSPQLTRPAWCAYLDAKYDAVVRKFANQLYDLEIAGRDECSKIAIVLMNAGCWSLETLIEFCPSIYTIQELQTQLGMNEEGLGKFVKLTTIQQQKIVDWIQRQSQDSDVGA